MAKRIKLGQDVNIYAVDSLMNEWKNSQIAKGLTEKSLEATDGCIKRFKNYAGSAFLDNNLLEGYYTFINQKDCKINSKGTYLREIRTFVNWVNRTYDQHFIIPKIPKENVVKPIYSDEDLRKLLSKPRKWKSFVEYRNWLVINVLIDTGIRASTLTNIKTGDIFLDARCIVCNHSKTKQQQILPISTTLYGELVKYLRELQKLNIPTDYLFVTAYGKQIDVRDLNHSLKKYCDDRGVHSLGIHAFRHTFAYHYLTDNNGNPFKLQKMLGHSTLAMTKHYCTIYNQDILKGYDEFSPLNHLTKKKISL